MTSYMPTTGQPRRNGQILESYNLPRLNHKEIENVNRPNSSKEIEIVIKKPPPKQNITLIPKPDKDNTKKKIRGPCL